MSNLALGNPASTASRLAERAYRLDEVEFMLGIGMSVADAVSSVGWTVAAAEIAARRDGRGELALGLARALGRKR